MHLDQITIFCASENFLDLNLEIVVLTARKMNRVFLVVLGLWSFGNLIVYLLKFLGKFILKSGFSFLCAGLANIGHDESFTLILTIRLFRRVYCGHITEL